MVGLELQLQGVFCVVHLTEFGKSPYDLCVMNSRKTQASARGNDSTKRPNH